MSADLAAIEKTVRTYGRPSPRARGLERTDRILSIDFAGPRTALVKVQCSMHPRHFIDYLALLRFPEGWRVVSKIFHEERR